MLSIQENCENLNKLDEEGRQICLFELFEVEVAFRKSSQGTLAPNLNIKAPLFIYLELHMLLPQHLPTILSTQLFRNVQ